MVVIAFAPPLIVLDPDRRRGRGGARGGVWSAWHSDRSAAAATRHR